MKTVSKVAGVSLLLLAMSCSMVVVTGALSSGKNQDERLFLENVGVFSTVLWPLAMLNINLVWKETSPYRNTTHAVLESCVIGILVLLATSMILQLAR